MFYEALFVICSLSPINQWVGDQDSGATCVVAEKANFETLKQCEFRLRETLRVVRTHEEQKRIAMRLQGPYSYDMSCKITVDQGLLDCVDCPKDNLNRK
jgi:hypothetical protein